MDMLGPTLMLYLLIGAGVAGGLYLTPGRGQPVNIVLAFPFWPLYLPILLAQPRGASSLRAAPLPDDAMTAAIRQVEREFAAIALPPNAGGSFRERMTVLHASWIAQADRVRAMDRLLSLPESDDASSHVSANANGSFEIADAVRDSQAARQANLDRLRQVRHETFDDLMARLARVRELVSRIYVAQFSGASQTGLHELFEQLTACGDEKPIDGEADAGIQARLP